MFLSQDIQVFVQESNYRQVNGHDRPTFIICPSTVLCYYGNGQSFFLLITGKQFLRDNRNNI